MSSRPLLVGNVDNRDALIEQLEVEKKELQQQVRDLQSELAQAKRANTRAVSNLRHTLQPLYDSLKQLYGEMDALSDEPHIAPEASDKWGAIKQRLAPRLREAVDILLLQGMMRRTQLANALKMDYSNCTKNVIGVLIRQGWVVDNGGNLSLKQL